MMMDAVQFNRPDARRRTGCRLALLPFLVAGCFGSDTALANPAGAEVVNGQATFPAREMSFR